MRKLMIQNTLLMVEFILKYRFYRLCVDQVYLYVTYTKVGGLGNEPPGCFERI